VRLGAEDAERASHGVSVPGADPAAPTVRLTGEHGLIGLAEPRDDGLLKPVVVLRPATAA
jgi:hypothetical protein